MKPSNLLKAALDYAERGWPVFPCRARDKVPAIAGGVHSASCDPKVIRGWFDRPFNIGLPMGSTRGVIDVDGWDAEEWLSGQEEKYGALPATVTAVTPNGRHMHFEVGDLKNRAGIVPKLDFRGFGGYVVAPPSVHPSGAKYEWQKGLSPEDVPLARMPDWLVSVVQGRSEKPQLSIADRATSEFLDLLRNGAGEGTRNDATARLAGYLLRGLLDPIVALEVVRLWNAERNCPPLSEREIIRTVASIAKRELAQRRG